MPVQVVVEGVGHYLPDKVVTSEEVERRICETCGLQLPRGLLERVTGIAERHHRANDEHTSDMACKASRVALERAGMAPEDIDLLVFASCTQDLIEPATANIVQEKLGAKRAQVFDIKNACNSFLNGLDVAESCIRTGKARTALVTVGEAPSQSIDWNITSAEELRTRFSGLTLGDAGAAAVIRADAASNGRGILQGAFESHGDQWRLATVLGGGTMYGFSDEHAFLGGDSVALREQALEHVPRVVKGVLDRIGWAPEEVDVACCHQVTMELIGALAVRCGYPVDRCMASIRDCGNTGAASIPIGLARAYEQGLLKPGAKVMLVGGAAGFSVGVIPIVW